ncbi:hypothetical protein [Leptolyngbya sp. 7M]|uniref:hypothetical protein n=1 Tax=Leptolyngbya sp. 7M TaxID=2812896 RepID=UPI001B8AA641|nr:hypothetical protein [Leptolyngbya sp. 7M]QYO66696.1 hypothetical protein JVX88_07805 [Leptolyngbya sp. 7M]
MTYRREWAATINNVKESEVASFVRIEHLWAIVDMECESDEWCSQLFYALRKNSAGFNGSGYFLSIREIEESFYVLLNRTNIILNTWPDNDVQGVLELCFSDLANCLALVDRDLTIFKRIAN